MPVFQPTWGTWLANRPDLSDWPCKLLCDKSSIDELKTIVRGKKNIQVQCLPNQENEDLSLLRVATEQVATPWVLFLDPRAVATECREWVFGSWFSEQSTLPAPICVAHAWGYSKPANTIAILDEWAEQIDGLKEYKPLTLPYDKSDDRIYHATISSWCLFANVEWLKKLRVWTSQEIPRTSDGRPVPLETLINYCADRRRERIERISMKAYGWEHHFGCTKWIAKRCRESLPAARLQH